MRAHRDRHGATAPSASTASASSGGGGGGSDACGERGCARGARRAQPSRARARTPAATLHPGAIPHGPPRARALTACAPVFVEIERLHADERVKTSAYLWEREGHANRGEVYDGARGVRWRAGVMRDRLNARSSGVRTLGASVGALPRGTAFGFQRAAGTPRRRVGMV